MIAKVTTIIFIMLQCLDSAIRENTVAARHLRFGNGLTLADCGVDSGVLIFANPSTPQTPNHPKPYMMISRLKHNSLQCNVGVRPGAKLFSSVLLDVVTSRVSKYMGVYRGIGFRLSGLGL